MIPPFSCKTLCRATTERRMKIAQTSTRKLFPMGREAGKLHHIHFAIRRGSETTDSPVVRHDDAQPPLWADPPGPWLLLPSPWSWWLQPGGAGTTGVFCQQTVDLSLGQSQPEPGRADSSSQPQYICTGKRKIPLGEGRESTGTGINSLVIILMIALST